MPLMDLSRVTASLADTLRLNITQRLDPTLTTLAVTTLPPERVSDATNTLNLYLYHVAEDPHYLNLPGNLSDDNPASTKPMSVILFYIMTAHHEVDSVFDSVMQQRLMGYGLKTFHDFSRISDSTRINGTPVLDVDLRDRDNALEISLRPVTAEESLAFWAAEDQMTTRLAAYYEVHYALLEPEPPRRLPGIVLTLGTYIVNILSPQLAGSRSRMSFTLPAVAGGGTQMIEASPARVGPPIVALPESSRLTLVGGNLAIGQARRFFLGNARWKQRLGGVERVRIDPLLPANVAAGWTIVEGSAQTELTLGTTLTVAQPSGPPVVLPVEPGLYTATIEVVKDSQVVAGQLKEITDVSNPTGFLVIPRVIGAVVIDAGAHRIRVDLDPSTDLTPTDPGSPGPLDILFVANGQNYLRHDPSDATATFDIGDFQPVDDRLEFRSVFDPTVSGTYPIRVIVEGAESQPFWIET
ncbi:Pvc16 family protein [Sphingomonas sp. BIUV-7]|uniref:Pvc16 family protein n=1 Tax=Sphingomonas natans TaxID=3063330 RepID=A0ABT8YEM2_9SPHN|nr:Pvc16 family protein [Sphingomonas sp. BIUV-7]MDO6416114.1 Pvc16 family protein [Sphingomonas sp. BIUV-7]